MTGIGLRVVSSEPIVLDGGAVVDADFLKASIEEVNGQFRSLQASTARMELDVFEVIDFRMLSALVGEALVALIGRRHPDLHRNPNIDGYPDLLSARGSEQREYIAHCERHDPAAFIKYKYGGLEVKNTFGTKKASADLPPGRARVGRINSKLDWKAHHRYTNHLLALVSDFVDGCPQIVTAMYSGKIDESDWKKKQNPKSGSTMTSFTVIERSGCDKLRAGLILCRDHHRYLEFFGLDGVR